MRWCLCFLSLGRQSWGSSSFRSARTFPRSSGPVLTAVWSMLLAFVWVCSWRLYHSMLEYSGRVQSERVDTVELVERRTAETLAPMGEKVGKIEGIADALKTSVEQWNQKAPATLDAMKKASDATRRSSEWVFDWIEHTKKDMGQIASHYEELAEAHRNDAATIYLVSNKLESLVERASILQEEIDELLAEGASAPEEDGIDDGSPGGSSAGAGTAEVGVVATAEKEGIAIGPRRLTTEDGRANRERGNNAQLRFCEEILRGDGKLVDNSIKEGTPDYVFYAPGTRNPRGVGAFKALTLREDGTRQRWIPRRKLLAEQRMALKLGVPLILFVLNFTNGRIWAKVVSMGELKEFSGLTTPLMMMENDPQAEKACKETLEMALQLL